MLSTQKQDLVSHFKNLEIFYLRAMHKFNILPNIYVLLFITYPYKVKKEYTYICTYFSPNSL